MTNRSIERCIVISMMLATGLATAADDEPDEERMPFKSMRLGMSIEEIKALAILRCIPDTSARFDSMCEYVNRRDVTYANEPAMHIQFGLFAGRLDTVEIAMPPGSYERMKYALDGKFGEVTPRRGLSTYMMNGDRAYLLYGAPNVFVTYEAAAGREERELRSGKTKSQQRKDM